MVISASADPEPTPVDGWSTVERVADLMAGVPTIGRACAAIRAAGWRGTIAGNRITVDDRVFVRYIGPGPLGPRGARWLIYGGEEASAFLIVIASERP